MAPANGDPPARADVITQLSQDGAPGSRVAVRHRPQVTWSDARGPRSATITERQVVGSADGVDLLVDDPTVSRLHAELEPRADGLWVRDLGSRNGTWVDGVLVSAARVPEGGIVKLGDTIMAVADATTPTAIDLFPGEQFGPLLGRSAVMRELFARLVKVAALDATVLLHGETGTGKELVARAIHEASPRAARPFVIVDCAALPENLLEAELFGHARGAFTGAAAARAGAFEVADGGTVFLDEIGELPMAMQPKLLRVLESQTVRRVGETQHRKVDLRFVSATNRDLGTMVNAGAFREDLYFRVAVMPIEVPPLRAHSEDVPLLVEHFTRARGAPPLPPEVTRDLARRPWLGNVRELRSFVDRALAFGAQQAMQMLDGAATRRAPSTPAMPAVPLDRPFKELREEWLDHLEREYVAGLLARHDGNVTAVAEAAGLDRTYVHRLMKKHDL